MKKSRIRVSYVVVMLSYLAAIIGFISVVKYIQLIYIAFFLILLGLSVYFERKRFFLPRWFLNISSLLIVLVAILRVSRDNLVTTVVETLLMLTCIKLIEDKKPRDHFQIYIISIFLIAGSALLTLNISFLLYFIIFTFVFTSGIVMLTYQSESNNLEMDMRDILKVFSRIAFLPVLAIPLTVFFFISLPRTNYPFLNFLNREVGRTGFTESVRLGNVSEIQEDVTIAFRASMARIGEDQLYWRGIVLDFFDGTSWRSEDKESGHPMAYPRNGIRQIIYLEPHEMNFLFGLDRPVSINLRGAKMMEGFTFLLPQKITRRIKYEVYSIPQGTLSESEIERKRYLQLPEREMMRLKEIASSLKGKGDEETAHNIINYLQKGYTYSLKKLPLSDNPLEEFLFTHRQGNCEYFASSMAVLLRLNGIPSRLIGGYRGGHYNDMAGYYIISQRDAHVWLEAYMNKKGWVRYDPTPAIRQGPEKSEKDILFKARLMLDTINYYWNAFVITYDLSKQLSLFNKVRNIKKPEIDTKLYGRMLIKYLPVLLSLIIIIVIVRSVLSFIKTPLEKRIILRFHRIMRKYGYIRKDHQGLEEFVNEIREPVLRAKAIAFVREIEPYIFGRGSINRNAKERLKNLVKDLK